MASVANQNTKVVLTSPSGESLTLKSYDEVKIKYSLSAKVNTFSLKASVFDETDLKKYGVGTSVAVYSAPYGENLDDNLIFNGFVTSNPKSLDMVKKTFDIAGADILSRSQNIIVNESYQNMKISDIVLDLYNKYAISFYDLGYIQPVDYIITIKFKDQYLYTAFERLAEAINYTFNVDLTNKFNFYAMNSKTNNQTIGLGDYLVKSAKFSYDGSQLANSLTIYGGVTLSPDVTQTIKGDGSNDVYLLNYKPRSSSSGSITVTLNGVNQLVGIQGLTESGVDCIVNYNNQNIKFVNKADNSKKILATTDTVQVTYRYESSLIAKLTDKASIEQFQERGVVLKFPDITDKDALIDKARQYLQKYAYPILSGSLSTWKNDFNCGEIVKVQITLDEGDFVNEWLQITEKSMTLKPNDIKVDLKFEQKKGLDDVLKNIIDKINDLTKQGENESVQQLEVVSDSIAVNSIVSIYTNKNNGFVIGKGIMGGVL
jgi:hypothetical protein